MLLRTVAACGLALAVLLLAPFSHGQKPGAAGGDAAAARIRSAMNLSIQKGKLANGLRVVMNVSRGTPAVAVCAVYDVGVRDEGPMQRGFTHLLEQLMLCPEKRSALVQARGGTSFSRTAHDHTMFCTAVPSGELKLALWIETQRMKSTPITEASVARHRRRAVAVRRGDVIEGGRGAGRHRLYGVAFQGSRHYETDPGASVKAISARSMNRLQAFFQGYYRPDNAVLSIAGDFDTDVAMRLLREQLKGFSPGGKPPLYTSPPLGRQTSERFVALEQRHTSRPVLHLGWVIPAARTKEHCALTLAAVVLAGGGDSLLYRELVVKKGLATDVTAWTGEGRGPDLLGIRVVLTRKATIKQVENAIELQLRRLGYAGATKTQLPAAKSKLVSRLLVRLQTNVQRAKLLAKYELLAGDARLLGREYDAYDAVQRADLRDAVLKHLKRNRRTVAAAYPPRWWEAVGGKPMPRFHIVHRGENLTGIAKRYGVTVKALVAANKLNPKKPIMPGQKLKLPPGARIPKSKKKSATKKSAAKSKRGAKKTTSVRGKGKGRTKSKASARSKPKSVPKSKRSSKSARRSKASRKPKPKAPPAKPKPRVHVVRKYQTLLGIAKRYGVSLQALCQANGISPRKSVRPGQRLVIPEKK